METILSCKVNFYYYYYYYFKIDFFFFFRFYPQLKSTPKVPILGDVPYMLWTGGLREMVSRFELD